jgi:hypothetical protein
MVSRSTRLDKLEPASSTLHRPCLPRNHQDWYVTLIITEVGLALLKYVFPVTWTCVTIVLNDPTFVFITSFPVTGPQLDTSEIYCGLLVCRRSH